MIYTILLSAAVFSFPLGVQYARGVSPLFRKVNPIVAAYVFGLILGNTGLIGDDALSALDTIAVITVALSIPLMLFSVRIRTWFGESGRTGGAMLLAGLAVTLTLLPARFLFGSSLPDFPLLAGMLVGVYTGGTPNLAAIRAALNVPADLYLAVHASDILLSALYLLFILTIARKVLSRIMRSDTRPEEELSAAPGLPEEDSLIRGGITKEKVRSLLLALGLAILIFGIGGVFTLFVPQEEQTLVVILVITSLSLGASMIPKIRTIPGTFQFGEYFILVFSAATGAMGNISRLLEATPRIFLLVAFTLFVSLLIHALLCRLFRIDTDTMLIASTAAICSPPFVGLTAMAIKRPSLIAPGITAGLIGYAAGNYLGIVVNRFFQLF